MRLGIDDTDGPDGGCTTHLLTELVRLGRDHALDVIGAPSLVRLNPNVPWKTRGNAALSVELGHGVGRARTVGAIDGARVRAYPRGAAPSLRERNRFRRAAWELVLDRSAHDPRTDPALVVADRALPEALYERAVTGVVEPREVRRGLRAEGAWFRAAGSGRGVVGAAAAVAWPGERRTWEAIAYRAAASRGRRQVDLGSVLRASRADPHLFLCHDPRTRRLLIAPHTPCPILFGMRATTAASAIRGLQSVRSEPVDRWLLFRTNQGTGDHLRGAPTLPLGAYTPGKFRGRVAAGPVVRAGGHVAFRLDVGGHDLECVAFEPTKTLPSVARALAPGDELAVWGGTRTTGALQLEGIRVLRLTLRPGPARAPWCRRCRRRSESLGRHRGYRCPRCRSRWPPEAGGRRSRPAGVAVGEYHPTPSARRHLAPRG